MHIFVILKKASVILVLFAILLQTFSSVTIIVNYAVNKEYISKTLCENRAKPKMRCNGKCHLKKKLAQNTKKENSPLNSIKEKNQIQFYTEAFSFDFLSCSTIKKNYPDYLIQETNSPSFSVFHPPSC